MTALRRITVSAALAAGLLATAFTTSFALAAAGDTYKVDSVHSAVIYRISHMGVSNSYGMFTDISGEFALSDTDAAKSKVDVKVMVDSIYSANESCDQHLKSPDYFNAKEFPEITFKSTAIKKTGENTFDVTGDFKLHGVSKSITVKLERIGAKAHERMGDRAGWETTFTIKRSDYGMTTALDSLGDEVRLTVSVEGLKS